MESKAPSQTAIGVAVLRVVHRLLDGNPKIFDDPVTERLLGEEVTQRVQARASEYREPLSLGLRAHVLARSRFTEDRLRAAVERGVTQYLILGAGLDTFAYRQPAWAGGLRIFELDHPASQLWKRQRLSAAGIAIPGNVSYVSADLESVDLAEQIARGGVDPAAPLFMSCLGVLIYLAPETTRRVLRYAASRPAGSELVFTYSTRDHNARLAAGAAALGEPWLSEFEPDEWGRMLRDAGFSEYALMSPEWVEREYFGGRTDGLEAPRRGSLGTASKK